MFLPFKILKISMNIVEKWLGFMRIALAHLRGELGLGEFNLGFRVREQHKAPKILMKGRGELNHGRAHQRHERGETGIFLAIGCRSARFFNSDMESDQIFQRIAY